MVMVTNIVACVLKSGRLLATLWTVACQAPLSLEFSRQEFRSGLPFPPPRDLPHSEIKLESAVAACIGRQVLYHGATWKVLPPGARVLSCTLCDSL